MSSTQSQKNGAVMRRLVMALGLLVATAASAGPPKVWYCWVDYTSDNDSTGLCKLTEAEARASVERDRKAGFTVHPTFMTRPKALVLRWFDRTQDAQVWLAFPGTKICERHRAPALHDPDASDVSACTLEAP